MAGSAWRKERRDAPLLNTWRNWCDAVALPSISVQKGTDVDLVVVDLSPLRRPDVLEVAAAVRALPTPCASIEVGEAEEIVEDEARPIHQLPRYELAWQAPAARGGEGPGEGPSRQVRPRRSRVGRKSAPRVKPGKSRRHGGRGMGSSVADCWRVGHDCSDLRDLRVMAYREVTRGTPVR